VSGRCRAWCDLVRIPNVVTAAADVAAGYLYAGGESHWWRLAVLCLASMGLYAGGAALNDVLDIERDRVERPDRPMPSGRVSRRAAMTLVVVALAVGLGAALCVSTRSGCIAGLLIVAIVLYDGPLKASAPAPLLMGSCRGLNLMLGMNPATAIASRAMLIPAAILAAYVTALTCFARTEARVTSRRRLVAGALGMTVAAVSLGFIGAVRAEVDRTFLFPVATLVGAVAIVGGRAAVSGRSEAVQRAVGALVLSIVGLDVCIVWAARGSAWALCVGVLLPVGWLLKRWYRVT